MNYADYADKKPMETFIVNLLFWQQEKHKLSN